MLKYCSFKMWLEKRFSLTNKKLFTCKNGELCSLNNNGKKHPITPKTVEKS